VSAGAAATPTAPDAARPLGTWRSRILASTLEDPGSLLANPRNWRTHPAAQRKALRGSLDTVGWVQQVIVNKATGNVVDGHARIEEALSRSEPVVPVLWVDLSPEEEALVLATLDPIAAMAEADDERLRELLAEVAVDDEGLAALLADLAGEVARPGLVDPDDVPEPPDAATIRPGDLWVLGDHRLLCGDAGSAADLDRLLGGAVVALLNTDPPYNVKVEPRSNNAIAAGLSSFAAPQTHHQALDLARHPEKAAPTTRKLRAKDRPLENDFVSDEAFAALLDAWFGNAARVMAPGAGGIAAAGAKSVVTAGVKAVAGTAARPVVTRVAAAATGAVVQTAVDQAIQTAALPPSQRDTGWQSGAVSVTTQLGTEAAFEAGKHLPGRWGAGFRALDAGLGGGSRGSARPESGTGAVRPPTSSADEAMRARVLENIAESRAARTASRYEDPLPMGTVYRRTDPAGAVKPYIGQARSPQRFTERMKEEAR